MFDDTQAVVLLTGLVEQYSPSTQERPAVEYLVEQMKIRDFCAHIDGVARAYKPICAKGGDKRVYDVFVLDSVFIRLIDKPIGDCRKPRLFLCDLTQRTEQGEIRVDICKRISIDPIERLYGVRPQVERLNLARILWSGKCGFVEKQWRCTECCCANHECSCARESA